MSKTLLFSVEGRFDLIAAGGIRVVRDYYSDGTYYFRFPDGMPPNTPKNVQKDLPKHVCSWNWNPEFNKILVWELGHSGSADQAVNDAYQAYLINKVMFDE